MTDMLPPAGRRSLVHMQGYRRAADRHLRAAATRMILGATLLLAACQSLPPPAPGAAPEAAWPDLAVTYRAQAASATVYALDPAASQVRIYVYRAGAAARFGHNHVLTVPRFEGYVAVPGDDASAAHFELRVPLEALVVDEPAARADTGGSFAGVRSEADIAGTRANMLGERGLDAARFPQMRLRSLAVEGDWPRLLARVAVTLHGVTHEEPVALTVTREAGRLHVAGTLILRQRDYGIEPFSALGGLLQVQDAVTVDFALTGAVSG
ncbi:MAG: YceI family protein [Nevskiaceae bacterium]|nr:MAG: YceI family protein [Nevskiaceae bacterium]